MLSWVRSTAALVVRRLFAGRGSADPSFSEIALTREQKRLSRMLHTPQDYSLRRSEFLTFERGHRVRWRIVEEFKIPTIDDDRGEGSRTRIVRLGMYPKGAYPDLEARDGQGARVMAVGRFERTETITKMVIHRWVNDVRARRDGSTSTTDAVDQRLIDQSMVHIRALQYAFDEDAFEYMANVLFEYLITGPPWSQLALTPDFVETLVNLADSGQVLAYVVAAPGERVLVEHEFTDHYAVSERPGPYLRDARSEDCHPAIRHRGSRLRWRVKPRERDPEADAGVESPVAYCKRVRRFAVEWCRSNAPWWIDRRLMALQLTPIWIRMRRQNANHTASYHLFVTAPDGMTIEDLYFHRAIDRIDDTSAGKEWETHTGFTRGAVSSVSMHTLSYQIEERGEASLALRLHRHGFARLAFGTFIALGGILALTALNTHELLSEAGGVDGLGQAVAAVLTALPGLAGAIVTERVPRPTARFVRDLRWLLGVGSFATFATALLLALGIEAVAEGMAAVGVAVNLFGAAVLAPTAFRMVTAPEAGSGATVREHQEEERRRERRVRPRSPWGYSLAYFLFGFSLGASGATATLLWRAMEVPGPF